MSNEPTTEAVRAGHCWGCADPECMGFLDLTPRLAEMDREALAASGAETAAAAVAALGETMDAERMDDEGRGMVRVEYDLTPELREKARALVTDLTAAAQAHNAEVARAAVEPWRAALIAQAWNEYDGRCWCRETPEQSDGTFKPHEDRCLFARALLAQTSDE